jgi:hypothetical protein
LGFVGIKLCLVPTMTIYRAYILDTKGKIFFGENVEALDEAAAIAVARTLVESHNADHPGTAHGFEIWDGHRVIFSNWPRSV